MKKRILQLIQVSMLITLSLSTANALAHGGSHQWRSGPDESFIVSLLSWFEHFTMSDFHRAEWMCLSLLLVSIAALFKLRAGLPQWLSFSRE